MLEDLSIKQLTEIRNKIAKKYEIDPVGKAKDKPTAIARLKELLESTGERIIVAVRQPDYQKRGGAKDRFPLYKENMLASEYLDAAQKVGASKDAALRDLRYDRKRELISIV